MSTLWEVPVATLQERELGTSRRLLRTTSVLEVAPPRDAHRSRVRRERLPEQLRVGGAASRIRAV